MATYSAAVIGAGGISARHIQGWQAHPDVVLVAIADISQYAALNRAEEYNIETVYTDYQEMLQTESPDLVSLCTWMITHAEQAVAAVEAGVKGVLSEKPFAGSLEEIDRILDAAENSGCRVAVGHHHRFSKINGEAKRLIEAGEIGAPTICYRYSKGGLLNNGSHQVDTARFILGDPKPVWALGQVARTTDRFERHDPIEDLCGGIIALEGGTRIILESDLPEPDLPEWGNSIHGTEGTLLIHRREGLRLLNGKTGTWKEIPLEAGDVGAAQAAELIDCIEGRVEEHRNNAANNRTTIEALLGIYESVRTQNIVHFPLTSEASPLHQMIENHTLEVTELGKYDIRIDRKQ